MHPYRIIDKSVFSSPLTFRTIQITGVERAILLRLVTVCDESGRWGDGDDKYEPSDTEKALISALYSKIGT